MIFFVHTPKTSGTTFESIIAQNVSPEKVGFFYPLNGEISDFETEIKKSMEINYKEKGNNEYDFIVGHYTYGLHNFFNKDYRYISTIRNPIKHGVSLFKAFRRMSMDYQNKIMNGAENNFYNFIGMHSYRNMQTFFISGLSQTEINSDPQAAFNKTIEVVKKDYIGFIFPDYFNKSLLLLNKKLKFRHLYYKRKNVATNSENLPYDYANIIMQFNKADILLYDYLISNYLNSSEKVSLLSLGIFSFKNRLKHLIN